MKSQLVFLFLCITGGGLCYRQEIILYDNVELTGTSYVLQEPAPDTSFVGTVRSFCTRGFWMAYYEPNFEGTVINYHGNNGSLYCINNTGGDYKSFRYGGASDTSEEGISIFPEPAYHGQLLYTNASTMTGIYGKSILYSGGSKWTIYEGQEFTGRYCCVGTSDAYMELGVDGEYNVGSALKLPQIGSILKGCPPTNQLRSYSKCYDAESPAIVVVPKY